MIDYSDQIGPRAADLGGGCRLRMLERGEEVGGGVIALSEYATAENAEEAASDASDAARKWLMKMLMLAYLPHCVQTGYPHHPSWRI